MKQMIVTVALIILGVAIYQMIMGADGSLLVQIKAFFTAMTGKFGEITGTEGTIILSHIFG